MSNKSNRRRINISVDPETYDKIQQIKEEKGFSSACSFVLAAVHIIVDRISEADSRQYDLPDDEAEYIDNMFDSLGDTERTPDGTVPVRHPNRSRYG